MDLKEIVYESKVNDDKVRDMVLNVNKGMMAIEDTILPERMNQISI